MQAYLYVRTFESGRLEQGKPWGGKFLEKLWYCAGGRVQQGNLVISTELITSVGHVKSLKADVSSVSPLSEANAKTSAFKLFAIVNLRCQLCW